MSIMEIGDFTVWSDPETMTTTVSVDGRTEQVTQTVGEMLEILGRYTTRLQDENVKLRNELEAVGTAAYLYGRDDLKAENAKLRKLAWDMFRDFANADYELKSRCGRTFMAVTRYEPRLRELGVGHD